MKTTEKYYGKKIYYVIYHELINTARYHGYVRYGHIAEIIGLPTKGQHMAREVRHIVGRISEEGVNHNRPMLSAVVVNQDGFPGDGFFNWQRI